MRRNDREVTERRELLSIINQCKVCRIAMMDTEGLYIVPMNFGYTYEEDKLTLYFHCAKEGRKLEAIMQNPSVCVEMDCEHQLVEAETACEYGYAFKSIIGNGIASVISDKESKKKALMQIMKHQTGKQFVFTEQMTDIVTAFQVEVVSFSGKNAKKPR